MLYWLQEGRRGIEGGDEIKGLLTFPFAQKSTLPGRTLCLNAADHSGTHHTIIVQGPRTEGGAVEASHAAMPHPSWLVAFQTTVTESRQRTQMGD